MKKFVTHLKRRKEGLLIGGLVGAIAAYYLISQGHDLTTLAETGKSLLDNVLGRSSNPLSTAENKLYAVFIVVGATLGYVADLTLNYLVVGKRKSRAKPPRRRF